MAAILLVEDDWMHRDFLERYLSAMGHDVAIAADGAQAVTLVQSHRPELILMDIGLPDIDGWSVTAEIKASPGTRSIPVIALTAHALEEDRRRGREVGCDEYITKPVDLAALEVKIQRLLEHYRRR